MSRLGGTELRLLTYLAPGLPLDLFETLADRLRASLGVAVTLESETRVSAPVPGEPDPFSEARADLGFLCAPGLLWLSRLAPPPVELVPAAFQFDDPRTCGRPVFFADLVVRAESRARSLDDLRGAAWAYNDPCSLSGYFSVCEALARRGADESFFARRVQAGSHGAALDLVLRGGADCAALDSSFLMLGRRNGLAAAPLRVVESFGPFSVQPIVVRRSLPRALKAAIAASLLAMHESEPWTSRLARCGVTRLAPISLADYDGERSVLDRCERERRAAV